MKFTQSMKKNCQFRIVYRRGRSIADKYLVLYALPNGLDVNRLGISVSKKVGCAVVRNRVKRLIRESYRLQEPKLKSGLDLVFIARRPAENSSFQIIRESVKAMLLQHNVILGD